MKKQFLFILFACVTSFSYAQLYEAGFFVGGSSFIGDIGRTNYVYPEEVSGGLVFKYNFNPRIALRGTYTYVPISGDNEDRDDVATTIEKQRKFSNNLHEFAAGIEFNFYEYNLSEHDKTFTPYILAEFSTFSHKSPDYINTRNQVVFKNKFSYAIPFGFGIKGKLSEGLAYAIETRVRYAFADDLDYTTAQIPELDFGGSGNDWYTFTGVSLVYYFGRPPCYTSMR